MSFLKRFQTSLESLYPLAENANYVIAYSGGVDSHVLLHCCSKLDIPVRAVHVHHGLQSAADDWVVHCQAICDALNIQLDIVYVDAGKKLGQSPEEAARCARYEALRMNLQQADCLLTAQHLNDQAETLLLQLFRAAGSAGLASMPSSKRLGHHMHLRPLLTFSRQEIVDYATENALHWMEDPSNQDVQFDRNFIRKNLLPLMENRWPEIAQQLSTVAGLQSDNLQVLEDIAAIDLANSIRLPEYPAEICSYNIVSVISISPLEQLSSARLLNVLRHWVKQFTKMQSASYLLSKSSPTRNLLVEIEKTLINSQQDANPVIVFSGFECRRYQSDLYLLKLKSPEFEKKDLDWNPSQAIILPVCNSRIKAVERSGEGLKNFLRHENLTITFRQGGEQFHPAVRRHSQSLKKLFQEANIPPWERENIPLLYWGDELIAVIGLWVSRQYAAVENEPGWAIEIDDVVHQ
jgi:tRNA(Ile)-lysidine synthase